jgi:hypothetical protein
MPIHRFAAIALLLFETLVFFHAPANAGSSPELSELYRASMIVTGDREETRFPAIAECFAMAMAKASGNRDISQNPKFPQWASRARSFVWSYTYHDRLFGRQIHDEQGTRDRPFDLTVQFDKAMLDEALADMGEKPWPAPRPKLLILVGVKDMVKSYILANGDAQGQDLRDAFEDASARFAFPIVFAGRDALDADGITYATLADPNQATLQKIARSLGADYVLTGKLVWDSKALGWVGTWRLNLGAQSAAWTIRGVNYDAAFRDAVGGAAQVVSGLSRQE